MGKNTKVTMVLARFCKNSVVYKCKEETPETPILQLYFMNAGFIGLDKPKSIEVTITSLDSEKVGQ